MSEEADKVEVERVEVQPGVWVPTGEWIAAEDLPPELVSNPANKPKEG